MERNVARRMEVDDRGVWYAMRGEGGFKVLKVNRGQSVVEIMAVTEPALCA